MKKFIVLISILLFAGFTGCVTTSQMVKLEQKVADLEQQVLIGGTERAGASFYPFSVDLTGGGTGELDKITGTETGDTAIGIIHNHATFGNSFFAFTMDSDTGSQTEAVPDVIDAGDNDEDWELCKLYGSQIIGRTAWGPAITGNITLGDELTEVWNKAYIVEAACTVTLAKASTVGYGATVLLIVKDVSETVIVEVDNADIINLHGTPLDAGDTIDSPGAAGDFIVLIATTDADGSGTDGWRTLGYGAAAWTDGDAT